MTKSNPIDILIVHLKKLNKNNLYYVDKVIKINEF